MFKLRAAKLQKNKLDNTVKSSFISQKLIKTITVYFLFSMLFGVGSAFKFNDSSFGVKTVVIDAGHGGHDSGCLGSSSKEKHVALAISLKLGAAIEAAFKDVKVIYTRKTDVFVELHERAKIANDAKADLFICVHANANDNKNAFGTETFVMGLHKSQANLNVAKRENSSIMMEENYETKYEGFDNSDESYIGLAMMQSAHLIQSLSFAAKVQDQFTKLGRRNRDVKQAGFLVLYRTAMPSVLIETGFLTNIEEEKFLSDEKNQNKVANSIFEAFKEYKSEVEGVEIIEEVIPLVKENEVINMPMLPGESFSDQKQVVYRVQVASSSKKVELKPRNFKGFTELFEYESGGMYKYALGAEITIEKIQLVQKEVREKGYNDAFVIAFYQGSRISVSKAKEINKK
jgi:N-acetylmuramoyl-L-alanine amidase